MGFVDPDDYIDLEMYEKMVNRIVETGADICCGGIRMIDEQGNLFKNVYPNFDILLSRDALLAYAGSDRSRTVCGYVWDKIYKASLWENCRFPLGKETEDRIVMPQLLELASKIAAINETVYVYVYSREGCLSYTHHVRQLDFEEAVAKNAQFFAQRKMYPESAKLLYYALVTFARHIYGFDTKDVQISARFLANRKLIQEVYAEIPKQYFSGINIVMFTLFDLNMRLFGDIYHLLDRMRKK